MEKINSQKKKALQTKILSRYKDNARDLPWRRTTDPYKILVSEIMSQQTQVERVKTKYKARLERFPTVDDLAKASQITILEMRSGLGYNRRGLNLRKAATQIIEQRAQSIVNGGKNNKNYFPSTEEELLNLPGVGFYTAHAVMAFAYNAELPVLDINIKRVLITELALDPALSDKDLREIAQTLIPPGQSRERHNALMDYGALVLTSKKTGIRSAPQSQFVGSTRWVRGNTIKYLIKNKKGKLDDIKKLYPHEKFDEIIDGMVKEEILIHQKNRLKLAS